MKAIQILAVAAGIAALSACGAKDEANNAEANAALSDNVDVNADVNATDLNAVDANAVNAADANAADANGANAADSNAATNNAQ